GAFLDALDQRNTTLAQLRHKADGPLRDSLDRLAGAFRAARESAADERAPLPERMQAARLLGRGLDRQREDQTLLAGLLAPRNPQEVQAAAVAALGQLREGRPADKLLEAWKALTPTLRSQALDVLLRRADGPGALLAAVADRRVAAGDVPLTARQRL